MRNKENTFLLVGIAIGIVIGMIVLSVHWDSLFVKNIPPQVKNIEDCKSLGLEDTAKCLVLKVKPFYKYVVTEDDIAEAQSLEDIKKDGSDCGGYAYLYERLAKEIGYDSYSFKIVSMKSKTAHRFAVINNKEGYCIIDQIQYVCFKYGDE